jgi:hypothetical protein
LPPKFERGKAGGLYGKFTVYLLQVLLHQIARKVFDMGLLVNAVIKGDGGSKGQ